MYPEDLTGLHISGVYIHEPGDLIMNIAIAILGFILFFKIRPFRSIFQRYLGLFLLMLALASVGGIFTHGFPTYLGPLNFYLLWAFKNSLISLGNYFVIMAFAHVLLPQKSNQFNWIMILKAMISIVLLFATSSFVPVAADLALTYFIVLFLIFKYKNKLPGSHHFLTAFIVAVLSGFSYVVRYDIDPLWFTHKDIVHLFVLFSMWKIYKGIQTNRDKPLT